MVKKVKQKIFSPIYSFIFPIILYTISTIFSAFLDRDIVMDSSDIVVSLDFLGPKAQPVQDCLNIWPEGIKENIWFPCLLA